MNGFWCVLAAFIAACTFGAPIAHADIAPISSCTVLSDRRLSPTLGSVKSCDKRLGIVYYDKNIVVRLAVRMSHMTVVHLAEGEFVVKGARFSRPQAWEYIPLANTFSIRPLMEGTSSDLEVTTNKGRVYSFSLIGRGKNGSTKGEWKRVTYLYPDETPRRGPLTHGASARDTMDISPETGLPINYEFDVWYRDKTDLSVAPYAGWDDGYRTYLRYYEEQGRPVVHIRKADGERVMVGSNRVNDVLVVHATIEGSEVFELRAGKSVVCFQNMGAPRHTVPPDSVSPTERILKEK